MRILKSRDLETNLITLKYQISLVLQRNVGDFRSYLVVSSDIEPLYLAIKTRHCAVVLRKNKKEKHRLFLIYSLILAIIFVGCTQLLFTINTLMQIPSGVYIEEVILATKVDKNGLPLNQKTSFKQSDPKIFCVIKSKGIFGLPLTTRLLIKWFYYSEEIATHLVEMDTKHPTTIWLTPQDEVGFRRGLYRIEIFVQQNLTVTVRFNVK